MNRTTCPYLGLKDDPTTALDFPSEGNFCHHARPIAPIKGIYQQQFCLTGEHTGCPLFQSAQPLPMPAAMLAASPSQAHPRRILALVGIPLVLLGTTTLVWAGVTLGIRRGQSNSIANTGGDPVTPAAWSLLTTPPASSPLQLPTPIPSSEPTASNCPMPSNWVQYTVNPTDSLYRLSVIYGVSVETLQQVNCLGNETTILPGQVIYVPNTPSLVDTSTPTPFPPTATNAPVPPGNNSISPVSAPGGQPPTNTQAPPPSPTKVPNPPTNPPPQGGNPPGPGNSGGGGTGSGSGGNGNNPNGHGNGNGGGHGHGNGNGKGKGKGH